MLRLLACWAIHVTHLFLSPQTTISWFQNSLSETCRTKRLSSHWLLKTLPTRAGTNLSPLVHRTNPSRICWDTHCWLGIKVARDQPWCDLVWTLSTAHIGCSISRDSPIHENYWSVHHGRLSHVDSDLGVICSKVNVSLCKIWRNYTWEWQFNEQSARHQLSVFLIFLKQHLKLCMKVHCTDHRLQHSFCFWRAIVKRSVAAPTVAILSCGAWLRLIPG